MTAIPDLRRFVVRVRLVRAWRLAGWVLAAVGAAAVAWTALDLAAIAYIDWRILSLAGVLLLAAGAAWEFLRPLPASRVAASIDRRAGLKDRLTTATEEGRQSSLFDELQASDALEQLEHVRPKRVFPLLATRWHWLGAACLALSGGVMLLASSSLLLSEDARKARKTAEAAAAQIERIAKPLEDSARGEKSQAAGEKRALAQEMQRLAEDLRRARMSKEQLMQKASAVTSKARDMALHEVEAAGAKVASMKASAIQEMLRKQSGVSPEDIRKAALDAREQSALQQMMNEAGIKPGEAGSMPFSAQDLKDMGMDGLDPSLMNMTKEQSEALQKAVDSKLQSLAKASKGRTLTEKEKQLQELLKKLRDKLKLSDAARRALQELAKSKEFRELSAFMSKLARQMAQKSQQAKAENRPLSQAELDEITEMAEKAKDKMEQFAKDWSDPVKKAQILQQLKDMLEALKSGKLKLGACQACMGLLPGLSMCPEGSAGMPGTDEIYTATGHVNTLDKPEDIQATSEAGKVKGQRDETRGTEAYMEVKAPTFMGTRSSVPYASALPKYKREAEKALDRKAVPKEQEQRVKRYFESLAGGRP